MEARIGAEEQHRRGRELAEAGRWPEALEYFRSALRLDPHHPRYRSSYGVALALVERRFHEALELCRSAAKEEFFNADLYHNLACVHLAFGFKAEAIRFLRRGLMIDRDHAGIGGELRRLGVRRTPVLRFLPRRHAINRWLGRLRRRAAHPAY
jgi:tetratricopeptide (TPR) repeat protein